jgi:hypothetical protein
MTNKSFRDLYNAMSPQAREEVETQVQQALAEMPIQEFRQARKLSINPTSEITRFLLLSK